MLAMLIPLSFDVFTLPAIEGDTELRSMNRTQLYHRIDGENILAHPRLLGKSGSKG
jgi:hypothetical protein